jgi:hypothetical protein
LLRVKRYETPPPGFLDRFSDRVVARIEADGVVPRQSWLAIAAAWLAARPSLSGALGLFAGASLILGIGASDGVPGTGIESGFIPEGAPVTVQAALVNGQGFGARPVAMVLPSPESSSVSPIFTATSPFAASMLRRAEVQAAAYSP